MRFLYALTIARALRIAIALGFVGALFFRLGWLYRGWHDTRGGGPASPSASTPGPSHRSDGAEAERLHLVQSQASPAAVRPVVSLGDGDPWPPVLWRAGR